ncbi:MAG: (2Fe-2S)-binding protein [Bdellovibrionota bacterium]
MTPPSSSQKPKLTLEEIKARIKVVCICKGIKQSRICDAIIQNSCDSIEKVNKKTGSGSGGCLGVRCGPVIKKLIEQGGKPLVSPHAENITTEDE